MELGEINKTRIVLIPKFDKPKNLSQFRPISLCNVLYKIIATAIVARMRPFLGFCIDEAQGAFIPGRQISDNTLIAYEVIHSLKMKKRGKHGNFALKLDLSKAYDRVEWDFLAGMLSRLEGLSCLLKEAKIKNELKGAPIGREKFSISHLLFADDCIIFGDAAIDGACSVRNILKEYELASGQKINLGKSLIYFGANVGEELRAEICGTLGVSWASNPDKYLGLPMMVGRKKKWAFSNFVDRFRKRISGWSIRYLSMGGKEVFIKAVLQALPIYVMQYFELPKTFCHQLEAKVGSYLSLTWRSICSARDVFDDGLLWRIGSGARVNIWNDPWIPGPGSGRLLVHSMDTQWTTVEQLLNAETRTWNKEVLYQLFSVEQAERIITIPIAGCGSSDLQVYSGEYSVKSRYRLLITCTIKQTVSESYMKRRLRADPVCPLCKSETEDSHHLLWYCNVQQQLWSLLKLSMDSGVLTSDGTSNFVSVFLAMNMNEKKLSAISLWALWYKRNKLVNEGLKFKLHDLVGFIQSYHQDLSFVKTKDLTGGMRRNELWRPPMAGVIKLNFDASFASIYNSSISAVLIRDSEGLIMGACTYPMVDIADAFVAEARACERAIYFALDMGFRKVILEGDSLTVIKKLVSNSTDRSVLCFISQHIQSLAGAFEKITYNFIPSEANRAVHELAMIGRKQKAPCFWVEEAPAKVVEVAELDRYEWSRRGCFGSGL
ncbi:uncharacterized protein LOC105793478 [Gossypium raimondii]|uniref:uncharacterized protein LOC105793478 n=1 Tax=Gossypium raimondii TaxID=29730 RepID=UPI00227AB6B4|nr:uncharacterized protein LOC105793478 [Gossypium raimondii]